MARSSRQNHLRLQTLTRALLDGVPRPRKTKAPRAGLHLSPKSEILMINPCSPWFPEGMPVSLPFRPVFPGQDHVPQGHCLLARHLLSPSPDSEGLSSVFSSSLPSPTNSPSPSPMDSLDWLEALSGGPPLGCGPPAPSIFSADLSDSSGTRLWDLLEDPW